MARRDDWREKLPRSGVQADYTPTARAAQALISLYLEIGYKMEPAEAERLYRLAGWPQP